VYWKNPLAGLSGGKLSWPLFLANNVFRRMYMTMRAAMLRTSRDDPALIVTTVTVVSELSLGTTVGAGPVTVARLSLLKRLPLIPRDEADVCT
jgi:hypothetical protein